MRDRVTLLIAIILLAGVTATSYWYARVLRKSAPAVAVRPGTPDFEAEQLVITQFDGRGQARNKLFAEKLVHFLENDDINLTAPRLISLLPDQPQLEVRARSGKVENAGERVHLYGDVIVTRAAAQNLAPLKLTTNYLLAIPDLDLYSTDQAVVVERGSARIVANGMQLDNIARTAEFDGDVRISLPPAERAD